MKKRLPLPLQGQHYKMAAIIARGWAYEEEGKKSRLKSVCQFNTEKIFTYTSNEKKQNNNKKFFTYMKVKKNRDIKIEKCVSEPPKIGGGSNVVIDSLFMSHLIRQETEKKLKVKIIEEKFLKLLEATNDLKNNKIIQQKRSVKTIKDYITLQYIRNPLFYRFLINEYFKTKMSKIQNNIDKNIYRDKYPIEFKELALLDKNRLNELIDFCNEEIISLYKFYRNKLEKYSIITYSHESVNNYMGDMSSFNFDFERLGTNLNEVQKITDYQNNKKILDNCIYTVVSSNAFILAIEAKDYKGDLDIENKFKTIILPIVLKGFHNSLIFLYSKYIICNPLKKEFMIQDIKNFFDINSLKYFYDVREEEISYLESLENLLIGLKEKEKFLR